MISKLKAFPLIFLDFVSSRKFLVLTFAWFVFQSLYMAFSTAFGVPPDETYHYNFIRFFSENGLSPFLSSQVSFFDLGEAVKTPFFLYHYLLSLPFYVFSGYEHAYILLRLINIAIGVGSVYLMYKIANQGRVSKLARNLSIFMLTNTLMFVFLGASVNYDSLFVFLSLSSVLLLLLILDKLTLKRVLLLIITLLSGLLVKINFLPIALIVLVILFFKFYKDIPKQLSSLRRSAKQSKYQNITLTAILLFLLIAFTQRYIGNLINYQTYEPKCLQVLTVEQCSENAIFVRNERLNNMERPEATKGTYSYITDWSSLMIERTYGIFAHKSSTPTKLISIGAQVFLLIAIVLIIRKFSYKDKKIAILALISLFYLLVLILDNYMRYQKYGSFTFAVHGRYLFAILPLMYLIANNYILKQLKHTILKFIFAVCIIATFATASLPSYIYVTNPDWHTQKTQKLNKNLKKSFQSIIP